MSSDSIDLDDYFPYYLGTIANRWTATSSRIYLERFGIGIGEWRVLASIQSLGQASALQVLQLISMDASAVSRSISRLETNKLIRPVKGKFAGRTKPYEITDDGSVLYARMRDVARERESRLLAALTPGERQQLIAMMRKLMERLGDL